MGEVWIFYGTTQLQINVYSGITFLSSAKEKTPIKVTLRDGKVVDGLAWKTTPYEIASSIRYLETLIGHLQAWF